VVRPQPSFCSSRNYCHYSFICAIRHLCPTTSRSLWFRWITATQICGVARATPSDPQCGQDAEAEARGHAIWRMSPLVGIC
jgi:hypothetical protein